MQQSNENSSVNPAVDVQRHRAAIRRTDPSLPLKCLIRDDLLNKETSFFDYGCGYGDDLDQVTRLGIKAFGWDPAYRPDGEKQNADVVNLGYVINVIEDQVERKKTLRAAWDYATKVLAVAARIAVDGSVDGEFEFGDGIITKIQTFQKYFTQTELRIYIQETLGVEPIPAAPGVFYVFKDETLQASYSASKYRRRTNLPRRQIATIDFDRHRELLEPLMRIAADLGRLPHQDEFERSGEVIEKFGTLKRAFKLVRKVTGADPWDAARQSRVDDMRVFMALGRFPKRPKLFQLPVSIQRDIKDFFGSYKSACESADALLFEAGDSSLVDAACARSEIGRLTQNGLYVHRSSIQSLEPILRVFEGCARQYLGDIDDANVIKLHRFSGKVSYLAVPRFEDAPHPAVRRVVKLSLRHLRMQCIDHADNRNPLLLDRKEKMLETDHPWHDRFQRFSLQEGQHGLLDNLENMISAEQWVLRLKQAGLMIRGNRLLYQEGVKQKRLPPKETIGGAKDSRQIEDRDQVSSEVHELPAIKAIDSDQEDYSDSSPSTDSLRKKEEKLALPTRSKHFGVGKEIGYAIYVHSQYEERLGDTIAWAKRYLPENYSYNIVKLNQRNESVSFIHCPSFDTEHEPTIASIIVISGNGTVQRRTVPSDPYIYHHKWLFVEDDYHGFNVNESKERSRQWMSLQDVDRTRIGRASYWKEKVLPRLTSPGKPCVQKAWYRSTEARKILKISSCQLAHMRNEGKLEFKKEGNAFLYCIDAEATDDKTK